MSEVTDYSPGTFCWVDSGTNDVDAARKFYASVFGWEYLTSPETGYTMCLKGGRPVAGIYALMPDMVQAGTPPHWMSYVAVADADATLAKAAGAGARPMGPVFDVPKEGRGGVFADPAGAMCGIWQGSGHKGAGLAGEHGTASWCELQTHDPIAAAAFYSSVFGWAHETMPMPEGPYYLFKDGEAQRAGMMAITPAMGSVPPNWSVYFQVDDADAAVAAAVEGGGAVVAPVMVIAGVGRFGVLRSADGAFFSILEPAPMA